MFSCGTEAVSLVSPAQEGRLIDIWSDLVDGLFFSAEPLTPFWLFGTLLILLLGCTVAFLSENNGLDIVTLVDDFGEDFTSLAVAFPGLP